MFQRVFSRRTIAVFAVYLLFFASLQAALSASADHGVRRFVEVTALPGSTRAPHDHATTVCHSCAGHFCLEQHGALGHASAAPAVLVAITMTIEPWPAAEAWAHPPTAPPRATFVHFISLPRAPPPELS